MQTKILENTVKKCFHESNLIKHQVSLNSIQKFVYITLYFSLINVYCLKSLVSSQQENNLFILPLQCAKRKSFFLYL